MFIDILLCAKCSSKRTRSTLLNPYASLWEDPEEVCLLTYEGILAQIDQGTCPGSDRKYLMTLGFKSMQSDSPLSSIN